MSTLIRGALVATFIACTPVGTEGGPCQFKGGILGGSWVCDDGLVCNEAIDPETCERPNTHPLGDKCARDTNCLPTLWCPPGAASTCSERILEGQPCPSGAGCAAGLSCVKEGEGTGETITCRATP